MISPSIGTSAGAKERDVELSETSNFKVGSSCSNRAWLGVSRDFEVGRQARAGH